MKSEQCEKRTIDYKWVIVALCFLMVFTCLGFCSSTKSLFVAPVTEALGIKRSAFSLNDSCRYIATAVVNIFFGTLINRFGPRKLICAGFISLVLSALIYSMASNVFLFYLGGCLLGIGLSWTTTTMVGSVVSRWFKEGKGTIMGLVLAANGIGGALATQIVSPIIYQEGNPFGYRRAYLLIAAVVFVVGAVVVLFFKDNPKKIDGITQNTSGKKARGQSWTGIDYSAAVKQKYFYGAAVCIFLSGFCLQGVSGVAAAYMKDTGLTASYVATVISIHSLAIAFFKFSTGFMYDKTGLRVTVNICTITAACVMFMLAMITNTAVGKILAMVYGVFSSLALPLETIMLPIYASDLFGEKSYNKVLGIFVSINTAGYALGAIILNAIFDLLGSYRLGFVMCAFLMVTVTVVMQFVIKAGKRQRDAVMQKEASVC